MAVVRPAAAQIAPKTSEATSRARLVAVTSSERPLARRRSGRKVLAWAMRTPSVAA